MLLGLRMSDIEALCLAKAYIDYVREKNPELHAEANGMPAIDTIVERRLLAPETHAPVESAFEAFMLAVHEHGPTGLGYKKALAAYDAAKPEVPDDCLRIFECWADNRGWNIERIDNPSGYVEFVNHDTMLLWMGWQSARQIGRTTMRESGCPINPESLQRHQDILEMGISHATQWRPIETAPKDGRTVILLLEQTNTHGTHETRQRMSAYWNEEDNCWYDWVGERIDCPPHNHFTRWAPMPDLPKPHKEQGSQS